MIALAAGCPGSTGATSGGQQSQGGAGGAAPGNVGSGPGVGSGSVGSGPNGGNVGGGPNGGNVGGSGGTGGGANGSGTAGNGSNGGGGGSSGGSGGSGGGEGGAGGAGDSGGNVNPMRVDMLGNANRAPGFIDLSPPMGDPLPDSGSSVTPTPPTGWEWYPIDGTKCRDGSDSGLYLHKGTGKGLLIYLEGGGACSNNHYCAFNPANVNQVLAGDGQVVIGSTLGAGAGRQQPGAYTDASHTAAPAGIFDTSNSANPFKDWYQIYIPYCTGDVHFGTKTTGMVPNLATPQQFVGYFNMQKYIGRIVPTFKSKITQVAIAGSSAGGFGAALNAAMVQDAFGDIPLTVIDDSGPPFDDQYMPVCMQKRWRAAWGLDGALPPDCTECFQADGGGMLHLTDFLKRKYPNAKIGLISSMQDEVIRLFYSVGLQNCANYDTADPVAVVLLQFDPNSYFPAQQYSDGLTKLRSVYMPTGRMASYFMGGSNITYHQHLFRARFYDSSAGSETIAKFTSNLLAGTVDTVGP